MKKSRLFEITIRNRMVPIQQGCFGINRRRIPFREIALVDLQ
jgi:hypothetical protein